MDGLKELDCILRNTRTYLLIILIIVSNISIHSSTKREYRYVIKNQVEFEKLLKDISTDREITATLSPGVYTIDGIQHIHSQLKITGDGAIIKQKNTILAKQDAIRETGTHYIYPIEDLVPFSLFIDKDGNIIHVSEEVDKEKEINLIRDDIIPIIDDKTLEIQNIKIKIPNNLQHLRSRTFERAYGYFDSWWSSPSFTISHSDSVYLYCKLTVTRKKELYNPCINGEIYQYHKPSTCVIYNVQPHPDRVFYTNHEIHIPKQYDQIEIINPSHQPMFIIEGIANLTIQDIEFVNSSYILQCCKNFTGSIEIINCKFKNISRQVLTTGKSSIQHLFIKNCTFTNYSFNARSPLLSIYAPECIGVISNNTFNQYKTGFCFYKFLSSPVYIDSCKEFEIIGNSFINHPRGGVYLLNGKIDVISNHFYNDSTFNSYPMRNFSRDAGAIYCSRLYQKNKHHNDNPNRIQIKLNKIHDVIGKGDVRGIFIDDGRGDVSCYGNIVFNGQCYSIDSRGVKEDPYSSIRNNYIFNIVSYPYRMTFGDSITPAEQPVTEYNILLFSDKDNKTTKQSITDIRTSTFEIIGDEVKIDRSIWKKLPKDVRKMVNPLN